MRLKRCGEMLNIHPPGHATYYNLCVLTLIFDSTQYAVYAPLTAVFEDIICTHHYSSTFHRLLLPQRDCKVVPVQHELALVKGYKDAFSQIPNMLPRSLLPWSTVEKKIP
jgi:hypothetical protein